MTARIVLNIEWRHLPKMTEDQYEQLITGVIEDAMTEKIDRDAEMEGLTVHVTEVEVTSK